MRSAIKFFLPILLAACSSPEKKGQEQATEDYAAFVDPFIGTAGHGHTFPGATVPFGMVQLSPDTGVEGWDWCSGYHYSDSSIIGFSHTHLSGTGRSDALDILFMPVGGEPQVVPGTKEDPDGGYRSRFSHKNESAGPGLYNVLLTDDSIEVSLTATVRCGFHRYRFPEGKKKNVVIDLRHSYSTDVVSECYFKVVNDSTVVGSRKSRGWGVPGEKDFVDHEVFFAARFSAPFSAALLFSDGVPGDANREVNAKSVQAVLTFGDQTSAPVMVRVGLSSVDIAGAINNLDQEIGNRDFNLVAEEARRSWNAELSKIDITTNNDEDKEIFYTSLYHTFCAPYLYSDSDGRYMGFDRKVHTTGAGGLYTGLSLWDTFRATHPLLALVQQERVPAMINSMLAQYDETGLLPVWPLYNSETNCMIGYHGAAVIAEAYLKGIRGFDTLRAYEAMKASAMQENFGIGFLKKHGYIPADLEDKSVSKTLEYAYDDWCIAQYAKAMGKDEDYRYFLARSESYRRVFDVERGFMHGRNSDGKFRKDFDPAFSTYKYSDFIEGNAWQYTWFVPHNVEGLVSLMGGAAGFEKKLDALFAAPDTGNEGKPHDITGLIGQYAHGNEPSHHVAYLYSYVGQPHKTQERVREIMDKLYTADADGLCGNEDMGQMSAWYVFSALGFYPVNPAGAEYVIGSPIVREATIRLPGGKTFSVYARNNSLENVYVRQVLLNGKPLQSNVIAHQTILDGGILEFEMSSTSAP